MVGEWSTHKGVNCKNVEICVFCLCELLHREKRSECCISSNVCILFESWFPLHSFTLLYKESSGFWCVQMAFSAYQKAWKSGWLNKVCWWMGPMSIPLSEQIHIPHQCFFLFLFFFIFCDVMFNHKVDKPDFSLPNPKRLCFCTGHCGDQSKVKSLFISHLNFQLTHIIVLDVYSHCYEVEPPSANTYLSWNTFQYVTHSLTKLSTFFVIGHANWRATNVLHRKRMNGSLLQMFL
jgi:hypothetical protein